MLEGAGITPDIKAEMKISDLLKGKDSVTEKAIDILKD